MRSVEVNVLQRCASHMASKTDLEESFAQGEKAIDLSSEGKTGCMVVLNRISNNPYQVEYGYAQIKDIANEAKSVPVEWISKEGNDVTSKLVEYLRPLIQGEVEQAYENGLPKYLDISHLNRR